MYIQLLINIAFFLIGCFGILFNKRSILIVLMCIEMILLSVNLNFILSSIYLDDMIGQIFSLFVLTIAAAESAIGLAILILYYRVTGSIMISEASVLRG